VEYLALDPGYVDWTDPGDSSRYAGSIRHVSRAGGPPSSLVTRLWAPLYIAYGGSALAWATLGEPVYGSVGALRLGSGQAPEVVASGLDHTTAVATDGVRVAWAEYDPAAHGGVAVRSAALDGGTPTTLGVVRGESSRPNAAGVAVRLSATRVFFTLDGAGSAAGLYSLPLTGGTPTRLWAAPANGHPGALALDSARVYWADYGTDAGRGSVQQIPGAVYSMPLAGGAVTTLAASLLGPTSIAVDSKSLYVAAVRANAVYEIPLDTKIPRVLVCVGEPFSVAADDTDGNAYFTNGDTIFSHPK